MRLLDSRTLELVDVRDDDIPRYAILSHTWGDDEVTLQEMRLMPSRIPQHFNWQRPILLPVEGFFKKSITAKGGYAKIKNAAAMALKRGLSYLWVDTCCIDKSSSSELSEAINSMYLWYKQAAECYAILSDVDPTAPVAPADPMAGHDPYAQLRSSRWFTRGWTLQELIAPTDMHFFARDWSPLGQKHQPSSFTEILSEVTGIEIEVLDGRVDPAQLSVATRMKWAAHRETTRLEDTAYCLMGLFQVNMPLLYGEGARAFARLQEEIIQTTDDQSLFAWSSISRPDESEDAEDPDALCGLLAACPNDFEQAGGMQSLPPLPVFASAPSTMTNLGLRVQLYLRPIHELEGVPMEEDFYAILDSVVRVDETYLCPAITLRRLSVDQYARLRNRPHKFLAPVQSQLATDAEGYRTVYVRQNPVYYNLPQIRVSPLHSMRSSLPVTSSSLRMNNIPHLTQQPQQPPPIMSQFKLIDAFPSARWNPNTLTMGVKYSRELQVMALFRFEDTTSSTYLDVVLGLRRLDAMQWEGWCFQLAPKSIRHNRLPPPATVIDNTNARIKGLIRKSKRGVVSTTALRESLGDDPQLISDATVTGIQLQGRLYVSVSVSLRPEAYDEPVDEWRVRQVQQDVQDELKRPPKIHTPESKFQSLRHAARHLTGPCALVLGTLFEEPDEFARSTSIRLPVRGRPRASPRDTMSSYLGEQEGSETATVRLALAAKGGDFTGMRLLKLQSQKLINSVTEDAYGLSILHWAMAGGHKGTISYLLRRGADLYGTAKHGLTILHIMAMFRDGWGKHFLKLPEEPFNHRLATSVTTGFYKEAPLHLAATYQNSEARSVDILRKIAFAGYAVPRNALDETPIHRAAAFNNAQVINTLTPLVPHSVNFVDCYGRSPLWHAAATGSKDSIDALLTLGASVNLVDDMGISPLHAACRGGHDASILRLLDGGAHPFSVTCELDLTPCDLLAMFGYDEILQRFMSRESGRLTQCMLDRFLHIAASCGHLGCVTSLIEAGADPGVSFDYHFGGATTEGYASIYDVAGNAQEAAELQCNFEVIRFLERHAQRDEAPPPPTSPWATLDPLNYPMAPILPPSPPMQQGLYLHPPGQTQYSGQSQYWGQLPPPSGQNPLMGSPTLPPNLEKPPPPPGQMQYLGHPQSFGQLPPSVGQNPTTDSPFLPPNMEQPRPPPGQMQYSEGHPQYFGQNPLTHSPFLPPNMEQPRPPPGQMQYSEGHPYFGQNPLTHLSSLLPNMEQPRPPPGRISYLDSPSLPSTTPGYSTTLPARTSVYQGTPGQFPESDASRPPVPNLPSSSSRGLHFVDNPPRTYRDPDYRAGGGVVFELPGEGISKVKRPIDSMYRLGVYHEYPPLVYVGDSGFEKFRRLPLGGFVEHNRPFEIAEALREQRERIWREEKRQQEEATSGGRKPDEDVIAQASHLHELEDTHVDSLPDPEGFATENPQPPPPPPLVYAGEEGYSRYHRWEAGGFGFGPSYNDVASVGEGREEETELDRERDAHMFRTALIGPSRLMRCDNSGLV